VFDAARLSGNTSTPKALLANIRVGVDTATEYVQGLAVDVERNLIYMTRYCLLMTDCHSHALVVLRGAVLDPATRALVRPPHIVAEIPHTDLQFGGGRREIAVDTQRQLLYVVGGLATGLDSTTIAVFDGLKIVDAQGQVTPDPAAALLGSLRLKVLPGTNNEPIVPINDAGLYLTRELAFNANEGLLYAVTTPFAPFGEGFISVLNSRLVINEDRTFNRTPHPQLPEAPQALIATLRVGVLPGFVAVDPVRNRVAVTNAPPVISVVILPGLSVR
jgi:hypothetical protein